MMAKMGWEPGGGLGCRLCLLPLSELEEEQ